MSLLHQPQQEGQGLWQGQSFLTGLAGKDKALSGRGQGKKRADDSPGGEGWSGRRRRKGKAIAQLPGFSITEERGRVRRGASPQAGPCKAFWTD